MPDASLTLGVHWTGSRWLGVAFAGASYDHTVCADEVGTLWLDYEDRADRLLVDVPVGLLDGDDASGRRCDTLARQVLGDRAEAVFSPPVREATRKRRHTAAARVERRTTGRELSEAAFAASRPIAALDELLQELPEARSAVVESHPEVCFRTFAGEPMDFDRDVAAGYAERLRTLATLDADAPATVQAVAEATDGADCTVADVLDAVALAYTAAPADVPLRTLPADPPTDDTGLPMRLAYRASDPLVDS
jgi:predicted RNase H-like nuclease